MRGGGTQAGQIMGNRRLLCHTEKTAHNKRDQDVEPALGWQGANTQDSSRVRRGGRLCVFTSTMLRAPAQSQSMGKASQTSNFWCKDVNFIINRIHYRKTSWLYTNANNCTWLYCVFYSVLFHSELNYLHTCCSVQHKGTWISLYNCVLHNNNWPWWSCDIQSYIDYNTTTKLVTLSLYFAVLVGKLPYPILMACDHKDLLWPPKYST